MHINPILLVDDDLEFCNLMKQYLGDDYAQIDVCGDLESAKKYLNETKYDALLLDINLNGQNGGEILKFLKASEDHLNHDLPIIIVSAYLTPDFIAKNKQKCADLLAKPFSKDAILHALTNILGGNDDDAAMVSASDLDMEFAIPTEEPSAAQPSSNAVFFKPVPFHKPFDAPPDLKNAIVTALKQLNRSAEVKKICESLHIKQSTDGYYNKHLGILLNVAASIAQKQELAFGPFLEKMVYAIYLHDLYLIDKPHLAKISSKAHLEQEKGKLQFREDSDVLEHPEWMAKKLEGIKVIPTEAISIVRQHHEMPDGSGFPNGISFKRLHPMSILFIIAHDFTDHIIDKTEWDLKVYCQTLNHKYAGGLFLKTISALSQCE